MERIISDQSHIETSGRALGLLRNMLFAIGTVNHINNSKIIQKENIRTSKKQLTA